MPAGPMALQRTFATSRVQMEEGWLQVMCYLYRGTITSDMSADPVHLSDMLAFTVKLYQTCMLGSFIQIRLFVKCCKASGLLKIHQPCLQVSCLSHGFV